MLQALLPEKSVTPARQERPLRVLHLAPGNLFGGVERTLAYYARTPRTDLWIPEFAYCFDGPLRSALAAAGATVHELGPVRLRQPWTVARARTRLHQVLTENAYDVVISHSSWLQAIFAPVVRAHGNGLAFQLHDVVGGTHWLERLAKRHRPDVVICNSHFTRRSSANLYPGVPTETVYVPVELTRGSADSSSVAAIRASLGAAMEDVVILQASRLEEWKGHRTLLAALSELRTSTPWVCWITGQPQRPSERAYFAELQGLAQSLGVADRVRFLRYREDIEDVFRAADIFCQANTAPEPFGQVYVEAMNAALPVVATDMGGAAELVTQEAGVLVAPSVASLRRALARLVDDPLLRGRMGVAGVLRAQELCDPARQFPLLVKAFGKAASAPEVHERAALSRGQSGGAVYDAVAALIAEQATVFGTIVDIGCGAGAISHRLRDSFERYIGCDLVAYDNFPQARWATFVEINLDQPPYTVPSGSADLVLAIEVIEHLENPRAFMREVTRIVRPGGRIVVTTPNQVSLLSKLTLVTRDEFNAFQEAPGLYPSHITALLEIDLRRIAHECGLRDIEVRFTGRGRIPFTGREWPKRLGFGGRHFSDNLLITAVRPLSSSGEA